MCINTWLEEAQREFAAPGDELRVAGERPVGGERVLLGAHEHRDVRRDDQR